MLLNINLYLVLCVIWLIFKFGFKDVFVEFVGSVIEFVNFRFKRMKLKDEYLKVYIGILDEEI